MIVAKIGWKEEPAEKVSYRRAESTQECLIFAVYILVQGVYSGVATSSLKSPAYFGLIARPECSILHCFVLHSAALHCAAP